MPVLTRQIDGIELAVIDIAASRIDFANVCLSHFCYLLNLRDADYLLGKIIAYLQRPAVSPVLQASICRWDGFRCECGIEVHSEPGFGTRVVICLPYQA